jgi:hypothetical protein
LPACHLVSGYKIDQRTGIELATSLWWKQQDSTFYSYGQRGVSAAHAGYRSLLLESRIRQKGIRTAASLLNPYFPTNCTTRRHMKTRI